MKKSIVIALVSIICLSLNAQESKTKTTTGHPWKVGGGIGLFYEEYEGFQFTLSPEVNYSFNEHWGMGGALGITTNTIEGYTAYKFTLTPYARYTPLHVGAFSLFIDMGVTLGALNDRFVSSVGVKPGILVDINDRFTIMARCGFLGYSYVAGINSFGLSVDSENLAIGAYFRF